jgi:mono/diheme cytochrome c family protein
MRIFFAASLAAALLVACDAEPSKPRSLLTGPELFSESRCGSCHGGDLRGSWMGPPLEGLSEHWEVADLARYLRDPLPVIESTPRLSKMRRKFPATMRPFDELTKAERTRLAEWLLTRP